MSVHVGEQKNFFFAHRSLAVSGPMEVVIPLDNKTARKMRGKKFFRFKMRRLTSYHLCEIIFLTRFFWGP